ncbi:hypothetical protein L226DRAFT_553395 [Lentinus tigrinus ALCF2SS1-7]|uniref:uncharacterized protein n=1 Tax=Lentinus tigrinus ALCF2SS1-7 TaxID=1328758 RepID=UPI001165D04E|nr:hypothetical protein L226DRAFT_553395 [Lentinus tigrinus ALCF2SS1-7]
MDKTKSRLAAFFDNDDEETSFPQKEVDDHKRAVYTQGTIRKSKREKEKEAAEAKRKEEEENAAKAYAEFLDAFQGEGADRKKGASTFVKAGQSSSPAYAPVAKKADMSRAFEDHSMRPPSPPLAPPKPKGKRAMDSFLEEIKREQADREARLSRHVGHGRSVTSMAAYEGQSGSKDRGDPETSNVFVANLPPHVNEQALGNFFARAGPVGSVKIMWPRGDASHGPGADMTATRRNKNAGLSGFVSFMKRRDAEAALREFDGYDWGGSILRVGWSKAVPIAAKPMYVAKRTSRSRSASRSRSPRRDSHGNHDRSYSLSRSRSRDRDQDYNRSRDRHPSRRSPSRSYTPSRSLSRSPSRRRQSRRYSDSRSPRRRRSRSPVPQVLDDDEVTEQFMRTVASEVRGHDEEYEKTLQERERSNPKYAFLFRDHRRHRYYRQLVDRRDPLELEFDDDGYNSIYSTDSAEESEREHGRKHELGKLARRRFEAMLRALSGRRGEMARCMTFSLEHAEAAAEVADIIIASLVVDGTPVPRKVARLHLICDILHNSAAPLPMAWKFRQEFQARLGLVFDHLSTIYHSFPGRITAETFKKQITAVVDIWEDWIVFPPEYTSELRARLEGATLKEEAAPTEQPTAEFKETAPAFTSKFKTSAFRPAETSEPTEEPKQADDGEPMDEGSDVDGDPLDVDVDGAPMEDVDGDPIEDVDGDPMDDVDGDPISEDVDGAPIAAVDVDGEPMDDVDGDPVPV